MLLASFAIILNSTFHVVVPYHRYSLSDKIAGRTCDNFGHWMTPVALRLRHALCYVCSLYHACSVDVCTHPYAS